MGDNIPVLYFTKSKVRVIYPQLLRSPTVEILQKIFITVN
jgi:hypothetical protein